MLASKELLEQKDERRIWELVTGWKDFLKAHRNAILRQTLKGFNTPKTRQVKQLFSDLLDLDVTTTWTWGNITVEHAAIELDKHMGIRGNIAHQTKHTQLLHKRHPKAFLAHIAILVEKTDMP